MGRPVPSTVAGGNYNLFHNSSFKYMLIYDFSSITSNFLEILIFSDFFHCRFWEDQRGSEKIDINLDGRQILCDTNGPRVQISGLKISEA